MKALLVCLAISMSACAPRPARSDVVLQWNQQAIATGGPQIQRTLAMVHVAMFDAVNAIDPRYEPYLTLPAPPAGASKEAAAAGAAHGVLVRLFPNQHQTLAAALARSLFDVADGKHETDAVDYGDLVAREIYAARLSDNILATGPSLTFGSAPGDYQVTDPEPSQPINANVTRWIPFALESASQFRPGPPPALTSARYARDFDEVRRFGGASSAARSSDQEEIARWHTEPAPAQLNRIARAEVATDGRDLLAHARLFAVLNVTLADALTSAFDASYTYRSWRPLTAIRGADADTNPRTQPDLVWSPLLPTPLHPEYPSPNAAIQSAGARVLTAYFGRRYSFRTTSSAVPDLTRSYRDFDAFADEGGWAGILGGSHFRAAVEQGAQTGAAVAGWVLEQCLRPLDKARTSVTRCRCRNVVAEGATPSPASSRASPSRATREAPRPSLSR